MVEGQLQKEGKVVHVIVRRCYNFSGLLKKLTASKSEGLPVTFSRADETSSPFLAEKKTQDREMVQGKIFGEGRNFR
jgi:error-prone DNA polymerase